jgi:uncharacterized protein
MKANQPASNAAQFLLAGHTLVPLPQKLLWWPARETLLVADIHLGKAATFRARGIPVPEATTDDSLQRLSESITQVSAKRVIFLGDFLHAREAHAPKVQASIRAWRAAHAHVQCILVRGNHDSHAGDPSTSLDIRVVNEPWCEDGLALMHHPKSVPGHVVLCGHLHPAYRLATRSESVRLPCFWLRRDVLVLPAFGAFTGTATVSPTEGEGVWLCAPGKVIAAPGYAVSTAQVEEGLLLRA